MVPIADLPLSKALVSTLAPLAHLLVDSHRYLPQAHTVRRPSLAVLGVGCMAGCDCDDDEGEGEGGEGGACALAPAGTHYAGWVGDVAHKASWCASGCVCLCLSAVMVKLLMV